MKLVIAFVLICGSVFATPTNPCDCPGTTAVFPLQDGESVVTCAGITGSYLNDFIDPNAFVAGVVDVRNPPLSCMGWNWAAPMYHDTCWTGNHLGQVFGIALDGSTPQNIYVSSTTVYGKYVTGGVDDPGRFGPSGPGAVYRINGVTGACTTCVVLPTHASLPGHGSVPSANEPSLGNICCDQANDILFATNFVDGKIYSFRCNEYLDEYDPFVAYSFPAQNDPATGFVILGERLWGIGVYQGRVYFSVWREDGGLNRQSAGANEIYSVSYNSSTGIIGSDIILEYIMPPIGGNYSNPVSDIEFKSGRMLLGERTMVGDIRPKGQNQGIWAHESRVKELIYNGTLWVASAHNFYTGNWTTRANCAGGVAYECMACDSGGWDVFSTGDALRFGSSLNAPLNGKDEYVYGIARIPCTGNQFVNSAGLDYVNTSNFYIDLDCITATSGDIDKTQPGDIDVAGLECDVAGAIHGKKWNDLNCNGIQELGEPGIAGWNITITKGSNTYTTMTGDSGKWWYMPLPPGNYNITEEIKPGWLA